MAPLDRAVPLPQVHHVALPVCQDLHSTICLAQLRYVSCMSPHAGHISCSTHCCTTLPCPSARVCRRLGKDVQGTAEDQASHLRRRWAPAAPEVQEASCGGARGCTHLDLDVARGLDQLLDEHAPVPESGQGLRAGALKALLQAVVCSGVDLSRHQQPACCLPQQGGCSHSPLACRRSVLPRIRA